MVDHPHDALRTSGRNRCSSLSHGIGPSWVIESVSEENPPELSSGTVHNIRTRGTLRFQQDVRLRAQFAHGFPDPCDDGPAHDRRHHGGGPFGSPQVIQRRSIGSRGDPMAGC